MSSYYLFYDPNTKTYFVLETDALTSQQIKSKGYTIITASNDQGNLENQATIRNNKQGITTDSVTVEPGQTTIRKTSNGAPIYNPPLQITPTISPTQQAPVQATNWLPIGLGLVALYLILK